jgi:hypothetical protein
LGAGAGNHQRENETADRAGCFHGLRLYRNDYTKSYIVFERRDQ